MDIVVFFEEKKRLTEDCHICCGNCKLSIDNNGKNMSCEELIEKWSSENPVKTMMDDFFEKFPNAQTEDDGTPIRLCPWHLGYVEEQKHNCPVTDKDYKGRCVRCWSRPLEVTK